MENYCRVRDIIQRCLDCKVGVVCENPMDKILVFTTKRLPVSDFGLFLGEQLQQGVRYLWEHKFQIIFINAKRFLNYEKATRDADENLKLAGPNANPNVSESSPKKCLGNVYCFVCSTVLH